MKISRRTLLTSIATTIASAALLSIATAQEAIDLGDAWRKVQAFMREQVEKIGIRPKGYMVRVVRDDNGNAIGFAAHWTPIKQFYFDRNGELLKAVEWWPQKGMQPLASYVEPVFIH